MVKVQFSTKFSWGWQFVTCAWNQIQPFNSIPKSRCFVGFGSLKCEWSAKDKIIGGWRPQHTSLFQKPAALYLLYYSLSSKIICKFQLKPHPTVEEASFNFIQLFCLGVAQKWQDFVFFHEDSIPLFQIYIYVIPFLWVKLP